MKTFSKLLGGAVLALVLVAAGGFLWATTTAESKLAAEYETHHFGMAIPWPLSPEEVEALGEHEGGAADEAALERGRHLVSARYGCSECHGADFGGGVMIDDPAMGRLFGPNLTLGEGSVTRDFTATDWDRTVRHGVRRDGRPSLMPCEDFFAMSDRELSDLVSFIRSLPPVDRTMPESSLGPVGKVMVATGKFRLSATLLADHDAPHALEAPPPAVTPEFGAHLAQVCSGCHRQGFEGGPIAQGPPDWAPATNLTPHEEGLAGYTFEQFEKVMREGTKPNGEHVAAPMTVVTPYAARMTDTEMQALWLFISTLEPRPTGR